MAAGGYLVWAGYSLFTHRAFKGGLKLFSISGVSKRGEVPSFLTSPSPLRRGVHPEGIHPEGDRGGEVDRKVKGNLPESRVVKIWQDCMTGRSGLLTEDDQHIEVVYPGRPNDDRGGDLRDAVIATGQGIQKGEVEVHVRSSSWWGHRHHQDPLYNRVILHVVYRHDVAAAVILQNGRRVPTLALEKYVAGKAGTRRPMPCRNAIIHRGPDLISNILEMAGDHRFAARMAEFRAALSRIGAGQVLYQGIMGALGYVKNKLPMIELARRMPLSRLRALAPAEVPDDACLARHQALLLGTAGLLPSQDGRSGEASLPDEWVDRLESAWAALGQAKTMCTDDWHSFKVRPGNLPRRRLAAMSYLLLHYRDEGLLAGLINGLENASPETGRSGLAKSLLVTAADYWGKHLDFGLPARRAVPALLGEDRADIIVVNVLLPFAAAWGQIASVPGLGEKAREIYRHYPALAENTLEKHMRRQLGISRCPVSSARRQQGLLHVYKNLCSQGRCGECPLGG